MNISAGEIISNRSRPFDPFFSICIPQYNRTDFLIKSCESYVQQDFKDLELCISDDLSNDGRDADLIEFLKNSNLVYSYRKNSKILRYDGNLRQAISMSSGKYVVLMGNDDELGDPDTLRFIERELKRHDPVAVAITNYRETLTGQIVRRIQKAGIVGSGAVIAASNFRNYSFVSGIVLDGEAARGASTDRYDGSEMYQMYLGTRLVATGGRLLAIDRVCVTKDVQIPGQVVDSYRRRPRIWPCPIRERPLPMGRLLEVVAGGLEPCSTQPDLKRNSFNVVRQLYRFTYPFWVFEYRAVQSWRFALGVYLSLRPPRISRTVSFSLFARCRLWMMYLQYGIAALTIPVFVFRRLRPRLYAFAKRLQLA